MKKAKLFINGKSQAVRLPKEFRFEGSEVYIEKSGDIVKLISINNTWDGLKHSLQNFSDDFMSEREQLSYQKRKGL